MGNLLTRWPLRHWLFDIYIPQEIVLWLFLHLAGRSSPLGASFQSGSPCASSGHGALWLGNPEIRKAGDICKIRGH